jgi:hypothetical protein
MITEIMIFGFMLFAVIGWYMFFAERRLKQALLKIDDDEFKKFADKTKVLFEKQKNDYHQMLDDQRKDYEALLDKDAKDIQSLINLISPGKKTDHGANN